jgi:hypothetical protein
VVREEEPPRPSTKLSTAEALPVLSVNRGTEPKKLTGLLRNELDWIVMKALEKERSRRYETANDFATDVQRYLSGEAVEAHPPSRGYRLKKFAKRNRGSLIATSLILFVFLAGMIGTTLGIAEAKEQEWIAGNLARQLQSQPAKPEEWEYPGADLQRSTTVGDVYAADYSIPKPFEDVWYYYAKKLGYEKEYIPNQSTGFTSFDSTMGGYQLHILNSFRNPTAVRALTRPQKRQHSYDEGTMVSSRSLFLAPRMKN